MSGHLSLQKQATAAREHRKMCLTSLVIREMQVT